MSSQGLTAAQAACLPTCNLHPSYNKKNKNSATTVHVGSQSSGD